MVVNPQRGVGSVVLVTQVFVFGLYISTEFAVELGVSLTPPMSPPKIYILSSITELPAYLLAVVRLLNDFHSFVEGMYFSTVVRSLSLLPPIM
ncbi:hypothetical protein D3C73_1350880 [compost metagenome]